MLPTNHMNEKLIVVMVGLPARGKSYITKKIANYLNWLNIANEIFNVGARRRQNFNPLENKADFFNPNSQENVQIRDQLALNTLDELLDYLTMQNGQVGIFDATNSTIKRREAVVEHIQSYMSDLEYDCDYNILFLESICNDESIIERNIMLKLNGPDYKKVANKQLALNDFKQRVFNYQSIYETVSSSEFNIQSSANVQYLKIIDVVNLKTFNIGGFLPIILNSFLKNFQISKKHIYLTLNHIDYDYLFNSSNHLTILSSSVSNPQTRSSNNYKFIKISETSSLDQVHDLILQIESITNDTIVQTNDEFLLNGILKYFNLFNYSKKTILEIIEKNVICINPDLYTVEYSRMKLNQRADTKTIPTRKAPNDQNNDIIQTLMENDDDENSDSPPIMTRSNSSVLPSTSDISTPVDSNWDHKFNYKDLNLGELTMKLELLK